MNKTQMLNVTDEIEFTEDLLEAIYILTDGSLVSGKFEDGMRGEEHRVMELVSEYDRYDGNDFWLDLIKTKRMLIVEPETKVIYQMVGLTFEQVGPVTELLEMGYSLEEYA